MYNLQQALIDHISDNFTGATIRTIQPYAGELEGNAIKATQPVPAVFVFVKGDKIRRNQDDDVDVALIVITDSKSLDPATKRNNNLQLSSTLAAWLAQEANELFYSTAAPTRAYHIIPEIEIRIHSITTKYCAVIIGLQIKDRIK